MKKTKVLLAMSGGVDSSVAALLLKKQGYEIIAAFMKNWSDTKNKITGECQWRTERRFAQQICAKLNIPLITLDFENEYKKVVVDEMFKNYKKGITPNPDVDCNNKVKFPLLWKAAQKLKCDFIATGHYVQIKKTKNNIQLLRAKDESKDQSYFLYRLTQEDLSHTLFPIGELKKTQVREIAQKNKFLNYNKKSTVGICFIGKVNLKDFLKKKIPPKKGKILDPTGKIIGEHDGIYYYTIGQRIGPHFGIEVQKEKFDDKRQLSKWYVAKKDAKKNILVAAPENHPLLFRKEIWINQLHLIDKKNLAPKAPWVGGRERVIPKKVFSRIRQVGELLPSTISLDKKTKKFKVILDKAITGVSQGQAVVLYDKKVCLGGGVISFE
jgi:tRNA-specific 2-thiouridylase